MRDPHSLQVRPTSRLTRAGGEPTHALTVGIEAGGRRIVASPYLLKAQGESSAGTTTDVASVPDAAIQVTSRRVATWSEPRSAFDQAGQGAPRERACRVVDLQRAVGHLVFFAPTLALAPEYPRLAGPRVMYHRRRPHAVGRSNGAFLLQCDGGG